MSDQPQLADRRHGEIWGGDLLGELVAHGKDGLSPEGKVYARWAREDFGWWQQAEHPNMPSWNMFVVEAACLLWLDPNHDDGAAVAGYSIADWWANWLGLQIGDSVYTARNKENMISRCFDGTETLSATYGAGRYGAVAAVRLLALLHPQHPAAPEIIRLTGRYLEALATLLALSSRPWTDPGYRAENGQMWYSGPTIAPVGERSEAAGLQNDNGGILETLRLNPQTSHRPGWPAAVFNLLAKETAGDLGLPIGRVARQGQWAPSAAYDAALLVDDLAGVRLWSEQHWTRWREGLLVWKPRRQNSNSPAIFWAWMDDNERRMTIGYPFPPPPHRDRGKGASGAQGHCILSRNARGGWTVDADAIDGGQPAELALPASGDPLWSIVGDQAGFREETLP